ncbi:MAG: VTT domain-containing protein [Treponema sp.]|nr:VTT domain-containing protein [Treponema sp.]
MNKALNHEGSHCPERGIPRGPLIFFVLFLTLTVLLCILFWPFIEKLRDPVYRQGFSDWVDAQGVKGMLLLFGIQVVQILIPVIPGEPVEFIAGAAYGAFGGLAFCLAGCITASSLIFVLVKKFGLPLVSRFMDPQRLHKYRFLRNTKKTALVVFILFLLPGTPKDMLTYIAPLSSLNGAAFIVITSFARIPSIFSSTVMGDSVIKGTWGIFFLTLLVTAGIGVLGILFSDRVIRFIKKGG